MMYAGQRRREKLASLEAQVKASPANSRTKNDAQSSSKENASASPPEEQGNDVAISIPVDGRSPAELSISGSSSTSGGVSLKQDLNMPLEQDMDLSLDRDVNLALPDIDLTSSDMTLGFQDLLSHPAFPDNGALSRSNCAMIALRLTSKL